ncbi:Crp/Fnr family transcriptional regulator [Parasalinivibrio latis]|uniref:Crp/Fnr family transcriptional regulator n=1 Tax=Parasalinivibrio latis TaxID=2952610 RepID=UPI0030E23159
MAESVISNISHLGSFSDIDKQTRIYRSGDAATGFFYILEGMVGLYGLNEQGKERLLRIYKEGNFFGYRSLFTGQNYYASPVAMTDCRIGYFSIRDLKQLRDLDVTLADVLMRSVCEELGEAENRWVELNSHPVGVRVMDAILFLFANFPQYNWTYREIGEYSGSETSTVIRFCKRLKEHGFLCPESRKVKPLDFEKLRNARNHYLLSQTLLMSETR